MVVLVLDVFNQEMDEVAFSKVVKVGQDRDAQDKVKDSVDRFKVRVKVVGLDSAAALVLVVDQVKVKVVGLHNKER